MPRRIGRWNRERQNWETENSELWAPYSATWPASGMTRDGVAYELPRSEPLTYDSGSSSLPTPTSRDWKPSSVAGAVNRRGGKALGELPRLLPTPEAKLSDSGPDYARAGRPDSGGDDLTTAVAKMLPTPNAHDGDRGTRSPTALAASGRNKQGKRLDRQTNLTDLPTLLPTPRASDGPKGSPNQKGSSGDLMLPPTAMDSRGSGGNSAADVTLTDAVIRTQLGARTNPRLGAGSGSPVEQHPTLFHVDPEAPEG